MEEEKEVETKAAKKKRRKQHSGLKCEGKKK